MSQKIEATLVRKVIRALKAAGNPVVKVDDGEELIKTSTEKEILEAAFSVDEARLCTKNGSWVFLTLGEGWDVICDYTVDLEEALSPIYEYISRNEA
ncbi:hypothetical protein PBI_PAJAZA_53 [Microbacterium phage Pajaza]|uniref:Uncharacterized protein n=1 Tax=Microbacterium phage Pajaza TaxID=2099443 RepID=A0A2P1CIM3_9CAUD|nr:hypothetical protein PBI_PAJAZA_53 [Microbacterium phage Pajaza]